MSISWFFWWVYQLPPHHLILLLLVCTLAFVQMHRQLQQRAWWHRGLILLLALWAAAVLWVTILNRSGGTKGVLYLTPFHSYREYLATGNREVLRSCLMNVALFYPAGLLYAALLSKHRSTARRAVITAVVFAIVGSSIEVIQYALCLGRAEIDDVLHNVLGAVIGCLSLSLGSIPLPDQNGHPCV